MKYTINSHITNTNEVKAFFLFLRNDLGVNFHPDEDFCNYINLRTHEPSFTKDEVKLYNRLMDESFEVCNKINSDLIYEILP